MNSTLGVKNLRVSNLVVLKVYCLDQQHQHQVEMFRNAESWPHPDLLNQKLWVELSNLGFKESSKWS